MAQKEVHERHVSALKRKIEKLTQSQGQQEEQLHPDLEAGWCKSLKKRRVDIRQGPGSLDECMDWFGRNHDALEFHGKSHGIDYVGNLQKNVGRPQEPMVQLICRK